MPDRFYVNLFDFSLPFVLFSPLNYRQRVPDLIQFERVSDDIYIFTSARYAQVTAGAIVSPIGTVLIDTLPFPVETKKIKDFVEGRLGSTVLYVINTHYHADHTYGTYMFPQAHVVAHARCRDLLDTRGRAGLAAAKEDSPDLDDVQIVLPDIIFETGELNLHLGNKILTLSHSPGHTPDSITVLIREDRILFAADTIMPIPFVPDGDLDEMIASLESILKLELENVVQGHGEVILRGEVASSVKANIKYLREIRRKVVSVLRRGKPVEALESVDIESMGKSKIALTGLAPALHHRNLVSLYERLAGTVEKAASTSPRRPRPVDKTGVPDGTGRDGKRKKRTVRKKTSAKKKSTARTNARKKATTRKKTSAKKKSTARTNAK